MEQRATFDEEDKLLHHSSWKKKSPSIDRYGSTSIDTQPHQPNNLRASTDNAYFPSINTNVDATRDRDYSIGNWVDDRYTRAMQDPDGYAREINERTLHVSREDIADILQIANGADNLFIYLHNIPEHQQKATKEFYDTTEKDEYGIYRDDLEYARDLDGPTIRVHNRDIRRLLERASRDEPAYICLPEHASSFTQTKLVPEIYTKDEINEMFYGVYGEQEKNQEAFQMKLDGVYYPLNDSISWLTTCMEEMKQDIAIIQRATDFARPTSIDKCLHTSIDNHIPASVDDNPPHPHLIKSQPDFHTRAEIDQIVEGIYRALESTKERLDGRCDDIYFPMDLSISALTSKIEDNQGELVEIQSYIARRPGVSPSIDRRNNKSTDIHQHISVDKASNRGRLVQKITSDMSDTHNHVEKISSDTYARLMRHHIIMESPGDRLQKIEDASTIMKDKWRREDEAMRDDITQITLRMSIDDLIGMKIDTPFRPSIDTTTELSIDDPSIEPYREGLNYVH
ncbi:hypothetical protein F2Q69_00021941 [Brassica cretica]|uniref:Uncharacterized protein n=1 Tax=Brassica cretica TaxID=69181 RepID=A0A8S9QD23_BRACR|nr:hypothetical protein F2Q69_00021941 [Brassica cretica]